MEVPHIVKLNRLNGTKDKKTELEVLEIKRYRTKIKNRRRTAAGK